jgi:hypothetical protein
MNFQDIISQLRKVKISWKHLLTIIKNTYFQWIFMYMNVEIRTKGGRTIPFLGIFVSNFLYCVFAV